LTEENALEIYCISINPHLSALGQVKQIKDTAKPHNLNPKWGVMLYTGSDEIPYFTLPDFSTGTLSSGKLNRIDKVDETLVEKIHHPIDIRRFVFFDEESRETLESIRQVYETLHPEYSFIELSTTQVAIRNTI